ncbi:hypothetical protein [Nocardioides sp. NPDC047086]|uniref:DUF6414 family protein n=1 Tax=Nocardioides sp. NPDC047086 TaxID=3154810 RepID=UPI003403FB16
MTSLEPSVDYALIHPIYLDTAMMISFLAHLEGGVATGEEETHRLTGAHERLLKARAGFRFRLPAAANVEAGGEGSDHRKDESTTETKSERIRTAASLFNGLYDVLVQDKQLRPMETVEDLDTLEVGQLVRFLGGYRGNPLEDMLSFFGTLLPYMIEQKEIERAALESAKGKAKSGGRSGNPAAKEAAKQALESLGSIENVAETAEQEWGLKFIVRMADEIADAPVHDILMSTDTGLNVVLTVSSEYYGRATHEYLRAGEFNVIGKVTRFIPEGDQIDLSRRTVLGAAGPTMANDAISGLRDLAPGLDTSSSIVEGPCVQVLPMAIYL